jgi:hypothetical protein
VEITGVTEVTGVKEVTEVTGVKEVTGVTAGSESRVEEEEQ